MRDGQPLREIRLPSSGEGGKNGGKGKRIFGGNGGEWKKLVAKEEDRRKENGGRRALRAGLKRNFVDGLCDA